MAGDSKKSEAKEKIPETEDHVLDALKDLQAQLEQLSEEKRKLENTVASVEGKIESTTQKEDDTRRQLAELVKHEDALRRTERALHKKLEMLKSESSRVLEIKSRLQEV
ncbi:TPA: hypothetical protein H1011_03125 [archaeon]|jgi:chromosome segregation ATPase|uniref:Uncharacterized protein n=1 Tax=Candidatus Undinarchaeum marinum TaxID=2756141 RepID=A0A832V486_9ARCH|nr:hypothetical protein [Candidatus Undinarchaeum marinum]